MPNFSRSFNFAVEGNIILFYLSLFMEILVDFVKKKLVLIYIHHNALPKKETSHKFSSGDQQQLLPSTLSSVWRNYFERLRCQGYHVVLIRSIEQLLRSALNGGRSHLEENTTMYTIEKTLKTVLWVVFYVIIFSLTTHISYLHRTPMS